MGGMRKWSEGMSSGGRLSSRVVGRAVSAFDVLGWDVGDAAAEG